jgi:hypothetical protein
VNCSVGKSRNAQVLGLVMAWSTSLVLDDFGISQSLAFFTLNSQGLRFRFFPVRLVECTMKDNGEILRGTAIPFVAFALL